MIDATTPLRWQLFSAELDSDRYFELLQEPELEPFAVTEPGAWRNYTMVWFRKNLMPNPQGGGR